MGKKYIFDKLEWLFDCSERNFDIEHLQYFGHANGPFCPRCHKLMSHESEFPSDDSFEVKKTKKEYDVFCQSCDLRVKTKFENINSLKYEAHSAYHAKALGLIDEVISLDLPPTKLKVADSDENYFMRVELTQKEGRLVGVVYIGEKLKKQTSKDKVQIFVDIDQQQVRFDANNKNPWLLLSKFECEFKNVTSKVKLKGDDENS